MEREFMVSVEKLAHLKIETDPRRVLLRPFNPGGRERWQRILNSLAGLAEEETGRQYRQVVTLFNSRHRHLDNFLARRLRTLQAEFPEVNNWSETRQKLAAAHFTHEYSVEAAALFNPSMVWHPDQSGLPSGSKRFILGLRATGEGHISSLTFQTGIVSEAGEVELEPRYSYLESGTVEPEPLLKREVVQRRAGGVVSPDDLQINKTQEFARRAEWLERLALPADAAASVSRLLSTDYDVDFDPELPLSGRLIFPATADESNGIEDFRFVEFTGEAGASTYYATYTAYDGRQITPKLLATKDFLHFELRSLSGPAVSNKGFALFPQKIGGKYVMLSRQGGEENRIMFSDYLDYWEESRLLMRPREDWEIIQLGNCGSPLLTEAGWLVLSHGVGAMRRYSIGAFLLDRNDPERVIGSLKQPLITPEEGEREGYVPNVVYSCGGQIIGDWLIIPYAMSDVACTFARVPLSRLLDELTAK